MKIGSVYREKGDYDKALENWNKALDTMKELGSELGQSKMLKKIEKVKK